MAEHKNLTGGSLHEPKGADNAAANTVYTSNGAGSGSWLPVKIEGQDTAEAGSHPLSNGGGGIQWEPVSIARTSLANSNTVIAVPAGSLTNPASFVEISDTFGVGYALGDITIDPNTKRFNIGSDGYYRVTAWVSVTSSASNVTIGFDLLVNGVQAGSTSSVVTTKSKDAGDIITVTGYGLGPIPEGATLALAVASDQAHDLTISQAVFDIEKVRGF